MSVYVAVDANGSEWVYIYRPYKGSVSYSLSDDEDMFHLPQGSIQKLIGRPLTFDDEPVKIEDE